MGSTDPILIDSRGDLVGEVLHVAKDPRTGGSRSLLVRLAPEAHASLHTQATHASLPARYVGAVRRGELVLDRSLADVARSGSIAFAPAGMPLAAVQSSAKGQG